MAISQTCGRCEGTGELTVVDEHGTSSTITCPDCNGSASVEWGTQSDVINKLNDIKQKCDDIMDKLNE